MFMRNNKHVWNYNWLNTLSEEISELESDSNLQGYSHKIYMAINELFIGSDIMLTLNNLISYGAIISNSYEYILKLCLIEYYPEEYSKKFNNWEEVKVWKLIPKVKEVLKEIGARELNLENDIINLTKHLNDMRPILFHLSYKGIEDDDWLDPDAYIFFLMECISRSIEALRYILSHLNKKHA